MNARFATALTLIRDARLRGEDAPLVEAPANEAQRARIATRLGAPIPAELGCILELTTRFVVASAQLDFEADDASPFADGLADARALGLGELFCVHDYGNGDGLYLEPTEPSCRLWWFGHDSWPCTLVSRSLVDYVERCASFASRLVAPPTPYEPLTLVQPVPLVSALARERDLDARRFLSAQPARALVVDLRGEAPAPVGVDDADGAVVPIARLGELVVVRRQ